MLAKFWPGQTQSVNTSVLYSYNVFYLTWELVSMNKSYTIRKQLPVGEKDQTWYILWTQNIEINIS